MNLSLALKLNSLSCIIFGLIFVLWTKDVIQFLGSPPIPVIKVIGILLLLNGAHLLWASSRKFLKIEILYFILGDFLWVGLTLVLIALEIWILNPEGIFAALAVSLMVGCFGFVQLKHYTKLPK